MNRSDLNGGRGARSGVTTPIHAQLERCIRECENRAGLKIIVAPSSHAARMIRTALARQGCPLVNVEALTPLELARHVGRTMMPDDRRRTMSNAEGALLVRRLTSDSDTPAARLLGRAAFPVWSAIQELRSSGVTPAEVARAARRPHERSLANLHEATERHLEESGLRDHADIMLSAIRLADDFAVRRSPELVAVLDHVRVNEQEERLIRMISGAAGRSVRIGGDADDMPTDRAAAVFSDWPSSGPGEGPGAPETGRPHPITAGERQEEIAAVLADIVDRGRSFDDVEIAFTAEDPYRSEIRAACRRYGIPFSDASRIGIASTRTGAAAMAALRWAAGGYPVERLVAMLRLGYVTPPQGTGTDIAAVLDRFPVSLAAAARPATRDRLVERARQEYVDVGNLTDAFRTMDALRRIVPGGRRDAGIEIVEFVTSFLREHVRTDTAVDDAATALLRELAFLDSAGSGASGGGRAGSGAFPEWDAAAAASFAVQVLERFSIASEGDGEGISIIPLEDAGYGRAAHVYVVGLDDQSCADRAPQDSLLTDSFRSRLRETAGRGPLAERPLPISVLVGTLEEKRPGAVTRCRSLYDISIDRPLFPGLQEDDTRPSDAFNAPERPVLDATDGFLNDPTGAPDELAGALFGHIEQGRLAAEARSSTSWTPFDGIVEFPEEALRSLLPSTHAPSALETLAECPYQYYLKHVLRVPVHESADPDEWMTSRDRGQILHELFERHARRRMDTEISTTMSERAWLVDQIGDLLDRFKASNPPPGDAALEEALRELTAAGAVYLHTELENEDRVPLAAEFRFGSDDRADARSLELDLGDGFTLSLSGRIDRIDRVADGRLAVTDFKTGKRRGLSESDLRKLDTRLQWAVYARLAREHFGMDVEASGYLFTSVHELGLRREAAPPPDEALERLLEEMIARVRAGFFARKANPNGDPCTYCDFQAVCGDLTARRDEMRAKSCESVEAGDERASLIETWNGFSRRYCS